MANIVNSSGKIQNKTDKKKIKTVTYENGEKIYNFAVIKTVSRVFSISEKTINALKNIGFYIMGILTITLFHSKPISFVKSVELIIETIKNICEYIYFITPFGRSLIISENIHYLLMISLGMFVCSTIFLYWVLREISLKKRKYEFILAIILGFLIWYIEFFAFNLIIKIPFFFKILSFVSLLFFTIVLNFIILCLFAWADEYINKN